MNKYNLMVCNCTVKHVLRVSYQVSHRMGKNKGAEFPTAERDRVVQPRNCTKVRKWRVNSLCNDMMANDNICRYPRSRNCQDFWLLFSFFWH